MVRAPRGRATLGMDHRRHPGTNSLGRDDASKRRSCLILPRNPSHEERVAARLSSELIDEESRAKFRMITPCKTNIDSDARRKGSFSTIF